MLRGRDALIQKLKYACCVLSVEDGITILLPEQPASVGVVFDKVDVVPAAWFTG